MNIIHLLWNFTTGGVQSLLLDIVNEQIKTEHVSIIAIDGNVDKKLVDCLNPRVEFVTLNRKVGSRNPLIILRLNIEIWKRHPDIIHVHMQHIAKYVFTTIPMVATIHNAFEKNAYKEYKKYKKIFSISKAVKEYTLTANCSESVVIYNGIHTDLIESVPLKKRSDDGFIHFVQVGRLSKVKGQHLVIEAFNILINKLGIKGVHIDLIGDGEFRNELEKLIYEYNLQNNISILGMKSKDYLYKHLCEYDCFIQPSLSEGFGLSIAEAMCAKLPIITSDQAGPLEVLDGGHLGVSFKTGSIDDLVDKLKMFYLGSLEFDTDKALNYVRSNFDVHETVKAYFNEYHKVMD